MSHAICLSRLALAGWREVHVCLEGFMGWSGGRQGGGVEGSSRLAMEGVLQSDFSGDHAWNGPVAMDRVSLSHGRPQPTATENRFHCSCTHGTTGMCCSSNCRAEDGKSN